MFGFPQRELDWCVVPCQFTVKPCQLIFAAPVSKHTIDLGEKFVAGSASYRPMTRQLLMRFQNLLYDDKYVIAYQLTQAQQVSERVSKSVNMVYAQSAEHPFFDQLSD